MDLSKEILDIQFKTFAELVDATILLVINVNKADKILSERDYKLYEKMAIDSGLFKVESIELAKEVLRNQFAHIQSIYENSAAPVVKKQAKQRVKSSGKVLTDIKDWVKMGTLTEEEADVEQIKPPDFIMEMIKQNKDIE